MAQIEKPIFIMPKRRQNGQPMGSNTITSGSADHIISVQGEVPAHYKKGFSPVTEHVNGIIHCTMEGLKSNMKINLPIINDANDEDSNDLEFQGKIQNARNTYNTFAAIHSSREIIDLSPIYENSSDGYSSYGELREATDNDFLKNCRSMNSDQNGSSQATPNSLSQTQSENSFEMGPLTDSLKNSGKKKKRVNIVQEKNETETIYSEITALQMESEISAPDCSLAVSKDNCLTMTGTIKRGKKKGQNIDVKLNISREELEIIEAAIVAKEYNKMDMSKCECLNGPHIFIFSLLCLPFVSCISAVYSFYLGTLTWYNIFTYITEELNCFKKASLAPVLILSYPFLIVIFTAGLGLYAGMVQLTFSGLNWWKEVCDFEKGFYGWLCNKLSLSECSPYEVVVLIDVKPE